MAVLAMTEAGRLDIPASLINQMESSQGSWSIEDREDCIAYANPVWFHWQGLKPEKFDVVGKRVDEVPSRPYQTCAELFKYQTNAVLERGKKRYSLEVHKWAHKEDWRATFNVFSLVENEGKSFLVLYGALLSNATLRQHVKTRESLGLEVDDASIVLDEPKGVGKAEFDVIFLLMMGYNAKQIGCFRGVNTSTVYDTLARLQLKFKVENNDDLVELGWQKGWHNYLPPVLRNVENCYCLNPVASASFQAGEI